MAVAERGASRKSPSSPSRLPLPTRGEQALLSRDELLDLHLADVHHEGLALRIVALLEDHVARVEGSGRDVTNLTAHARSFSCRIAGRDIAMRHMILRFASLVWPPLSRPDCRGARRPARSRPAHLSLQEALLRAKPAVVLVIAEVSAEVTLDCGAGPTKVTPPVFRETGTGWFVERRRLGRHQRPRGTAGARDASLAREPAGAAGGGHGVLAQGPGEARASCPASGRRPRTRSSASSSTSVLPTTKVNLTPQVVVIISNGTRIKAEVKKYSPPVSREPGAMSGRDLALLKIPGDAYPVLPLTDSKVAQIGDPIQILGFPGVVLVPRAPEQVGVHGSHRHQRRGLGLQGGRIGPPDHPDRRLRRLGQFRRAGGGRPGRDGRRAHLRVAGARSRGRHRPGLQLHHPGAGGARFRLRARR